MSSTKMIKNTDVIIFILTFVLTSLFFYLWKFKEEKTVSKNFSIGFLSLFLAHTTHLLGRSINVRSFLGTIVSICIGIFVIIGSLNIFYFPTRKR